MTPESFWSLIEEARRTTKHAGKMPAWLVEQLVRTDDRTLTGFELRLRDCRNRAYDANLWLAANLLMGPCSETQFDHFRAWLVSRGQTAFEAALDDPDSMANWPNFEGEHGRPLLEGLLKVSTQAYLQRTGAYRYVAEEKFQALMPPHVRPVLRNEELRGVSDEDARALLPKLAARIPFPIPLRRER